ncbi:MAG: response regulator transcription factor [Actinobacteria bacterium]|nr:response regulator transcription factor [Actinomycetota bacterium]
MNRHQDALARAATKAAPPSRGRVLVVEDEVDLAWVEQFNLQSEGYHARVAPEGRAALQAVAEFTPDLMLLDVMLPCLDGWSVLARLQELPHDRRPKVIVVSAAAGEAARARAQKMGAEWFLSKPFDMDELMQLVDEALGPNAA